MIRIAIIDDHPLARRGLSEILTETGEFTVTCAAGLPADVGPGADPDVVLLDLYCGTDGPCLTDIARIKNFTKVLVVSASGRPADVVGAIQAGADGYVTKLADPEMLVSAVKTVAGGGFALFAQLADILQAELARPGQPTVCAQEVRLSPREEQTLDLIAQGFTHAQTATRMGVTKATVDTHVERIRKKLHVGNKAELTRAALERLQRS
jgi:DNA-binding NarL/FixJ family response regulator